MSRCRFRQCHPRARALRYLKDGRSSCIAPNVLGAGSRVSLSAEVVYDAFQRGAEWSLREFFSGSAQPSDSQRPLRNTLFRPERLLCWPYGNLCRPGSRGNSFGERIVHRSFGRRIDLFRGRCKHRLEVPKRLGIATLTVRNLFDEKFRYQDDGFREFRDEPTSTPYIPERQLMGRVSLYF